MWSILSTYFWSGAILMVHAGMALCFQLWLNGPEFKSSRTTPMINSVYRWAIDGIHINHPIAKTMKAEMFYKCTKPEKQKHMICPQKAVLADTTSFPPFGWKEHPQPGLVGKHDLTLHYIWETEPVTAQLPLDLPTCTQSHGTTNSTNRNYWSWLWNSLLAFK